MDSKIRKNRFLLGLLGTWSLLSPAGRSDLSMHLTPSVISGFTALSLLILVRICSLNRPQLSPGALSSSSEGRFWALGAFFQLFCILLNCIHSSIVFTRQCAFLQPAWRRTSRYFRNTCALFSYFTLYIGPQNLWRSIPLLSIHCNSHCVSVGFTVDIWHFCGQVLPPALTLST